MTDRKQALTDLLAKVEAGTLDKGRPFVGEVFIRCDKLGRDYHGAWLEKAFHGSLDAAKALHEAVLPGWGWSISDCMAKITYKGRTYTGYSQIPASAWLIAIIKALIAEETQ